MLVDASEPLFPRSTPGRIGGQQRELRRVSIAQNMKQRAMFAACVRNCESALPGVLDNIGRMAASYSAAAFVFLENDSTDRSREILATWCSGVSEARLLNFDGLVRCSPVRTVRLALLRNHYLAILRNDYAGFDHLVVVDGDAVNAGPIDADRFRRAIGFLESDAAHAGVFAGQDGLYYDIWALRHAELCPGDVWEEEFDLMAAGRIPRVEAFKQTVRKRMLVLPADMPPLEVRSAFGGVGIYKVAHIRNSGQRYIGHRLKRALVDGEIGESLWQTCEHVAFNGDICDRGGRLFVLPYFVNSTGETARSLGPNPVHNPDLRFEPKWLPFPPNAAAPANRNAPCPCGYGRRYKNCHGELGLPPVPATLRGLFADY